MAHNPNRRASESDQIPDFVETAVFKRDVFSETHAGYFAGDPETRIIRRVVSAALWWSKPLAWILARREIRASRPCAALWAFRNRLPPTRTDFTVHGRKERRCIWLGPPIRMRTALRTASCATCAVLA